MAYLRICYQHRYTPLRGRVDVDPVPELEAIPDPLPKGSRLVTFTDAPMGGDPDDIECYVCQSFREVKWTGSVTEKTLEGFAKCQDMLLDDLTAYGHIINDDQTVIVAFDQRQNLTISPEIN